MELWESQGDIFMRDLHAVHTIKAHRDVKKFSFFIAESIQQIFMELGIEDLHEEFSGNFHICSV